MTDPITAADVARGVCRLFAQQGLVAIPEVGRHYVAFACVAVALLGRLSAQGVPPSPSTDPKLP